MTDTRGLLFGFLVVAMVVAGCGDDDDSNSAEQLYGTWDVGNVGALHTFESDGSWYVATSVSGDPYGTGAYTFDGSIVTMDTDEDSECPQTTGSYEVTFSDPDTMSLELIDDECLVRGVNVPSGSWVRVEED